MAATLKEIAEICGVTVSTVSNVLNDKPKVSEEKKKQILSVVEELGYQPNYFAQGIRKTKKRIIGIITEDVMDFASVSMVETIMAQCENNNYRTLLLNMRLYDKWDNQWYDDNTKILEASKPMFQQIMSIKADGFIYIAGHCRKIHCIPNNLDIPGVVLYGISADPKYPSVVLDDEAGGYDVAKYIIGKGYKDFGIISGKSDNMHTSKRLLGIQKAMFEAGIPFNPDMVFEGDWKRGSGYNLAKEIISKGTKCILCMNDLMAAGVYDYIYESGLEIGKDIGVIGYDNREISDYMRPRLTTYDLKLSQLAMDAAQMMVNILSNQEEEKKYSNSYIEKVSGELIIRNSL